MNEKKDFLVCVGRFEKKIQASSMVVDDFWFDPFPDRIVAVAIEGWSSVDFVRNDLAFGEGEVNRREYNGD